MDQTQENKVEDKNIQAQTTPTTEQVSKSLPETQKEESPQEINWKKFKEARAIERKQAEEVSRKAAEKEAEVNALKAAMESILNKSSPVENNRNQYSHDDEENEEEKITKRVEAIIAQREAQAEEKRRKKEYDEYPQKLRSTFSDFDQACNQENLDYIEYHYPELVRAFKKLPDGFEKWADIYASVKRFVPNLDAKKDLARSEKNLAKPQSASKPGLSQSGNPIAPNILSEERRAANWERMQKTLKGLSQ